MRAFALTENIRAVGPSTKSLPGVREAKQDPSHDGILLFCGISVGLAALAILFNTLSLPSAYLL